MNTNLHEKFKNFLYSEGMPTIQLRPSLTGALAAYDPDEDRIVIPSGNNFRRMFYSNYHREPEKEDCLLFLLHEVLHSTGQPYRLNRELSRKSLREELQNYAYAVRIPMAYLNDPWYDAEEIAVATATLLLAGELGLGQGAETVGRTYLNWIRMSYNYDALPDVDIRSMIGEEVNAMCEWVRRKWNEF